MKYHLQMRFPENMTMRVARIVRLAVASFVAAFFVAVSAPAQTTQVATTAAIQDFALTSAKSGYLVAGNRLFWTDNLGASWAEITPPSTTAISTAFFRADGYGWALTTSSSTLSVARTTDSGQHWISSAIAPPFTEAQSFNGRASISFSDSNNGFLMLGVQSGSAFRLGVLMRTNDGGATWQPAPTPPIGGDLTFVSATHGFNGPGPAGDELYSTADAGGTWQRITLAAPATFATANSTISSPAFTDAMHGSLLRTFVTDITPTVVKYETSDGGETWALTSTLPDAQNVLAADGSLAHLVAPAAQLIPSVSRFSSGANGLVLFHSGSCVDSTCTSTESLRSTSDGGRTFAMVAPISGLTLDHTTSIAVPNSLAPSIRFTPYSTSVYNTSGVMGFDACTPPTTAQFADWITNSPYRVAGIYLGGTNFACRSTLGNVTSSYISTVLGQGWQIIPIWVGLQSAGACSGCSTLSTTPATANTQGVTEADSAIAAAQAVGMGQGSIIMYDMEAYTRSNATNVTAAISFLQGWTTELHANGYLSAVYSSHPEFTDWYPSALTPSMDVIWFAYFFNTGVACGATCQTVFPTQSSFDISSSYWINNHRARQTSSSFNSTYGSTTINIDEDWVDAPFVTATSKALTVTQACTGGTCSGTVTSTTVANNNTPADSSTYTAINCGTSCTASFAPTDTVTLSAAGSASAIFSSWTGCTSTSGATCTIAMTSAATVRANFVAAAQLTVSKTGTGSGTVTSADGDINCGATCSYTYPVTATSVLTATAANGSVFTGWSGGGCTGTGTCTVSTTAAITVTANFSAPVTLNVAASPTAGGTITSTDAKINCGATCSASYAANSSVTLTAAPATGYTFTGWSGGSCSGTGTCTVTLSATTTITANFTGPVTLTVAASPTAGGTITSTDAKINCGATCSASYAANSSVTLTAAPANGYTFTGWSGGSCSGTGTCTVTLTAATTITANFTGPVTLTVAASPAGSGTITSADAKINCGATCSASYAANSSVTLTAAPATGYTFTSWSGGGCTGTGTCTVTLTAATTITANFTGPVTLTVATSPAGSGTITSTDAKINCGATCSASYAANSNVTLTAAPATGYAFTGWSGGGCTGTGTCTVTLTAATTITANFGASSYSVAASLPSITISRGSSGTENLTFTLVNGYSGTFSNFGCSVANITCSGSNVTSGSNFSAPITIAVASTFSQSVMPSLPGAGNKNTIEFAMLAVPALLLLPFTLRKWRRFRSVSMALACFMTLALAQLLTGCGGNSSASSSPTSKTVSVPITFTATPTGGSAAAGIPVTVSVTVTY